jgi:hypothetical protein
MKKEWTPGRALFIASFLPYIILLVYAIVVALTRELDYGWFSFSDTRGKLFLWGLIECLYYFWWIFLLLILFHFGYLLFAIVRGIHRAFRGERVAIEEREEPDEPDNDPREEKIE